ncbi:hypothetical protein EJB05_44666, partial [Eragrostis curvula]
MAAVVAAPRVMVLPFPAQGHVMPLMAVAHRLVEHGIEVEFVNTDFNHDRIIKAGGEAVPVGINMVSFPDGMGPDGDRADIGKLAAGLLATMLGPIQEMVVSKKIRWVVADVAMSWVVAATAGCGVRVALFPLTSAAAFVLRLHVPKLIEDGIIDEIGKMYMQFQLHIVRTRFEIKFDDRSARRRAAGNVRRKERIQVIPRTPALDASELPWAGLGKNVIQSIIRSIPALAVAEVIVCNTFEDIESEALALFPKPALAVGPLVVSTCSSGHFWPQDRTCLSWLDAQAPRSVVYVAFGSLAVLEPTRFQELADGLLLTGRPFLWVVRPNFAGGDGEVDELKRRVGGAGLVVGWAPQQGVLSHPSVACFVTHCGWNSTMEGARHGVPLLCWPYFGDQFCNRSYVCDVWRTGMRLCADERGVVAKEEIRDKVARLLGDEGIQARVLSLKKAACASAADGGSSHRDLLKFVNLLREQ